MLSLYLQFANNQSTKRNFEPITSCRISERPFVSTAIKSPLASTAHSYSAPHPRCMALVAVSFAILPQLLTSPVATTILPQPPPSLLQPSQSFRSRCGSTYSRHDASAFGSSLPCAHGEHVSMLISK